MTKFERVLSDGEVHNLFALNNEVFCADSEGDFYTREGINPVDTVCLFEIGRNIEQVVLAKLAEQEPVMYARTYYGEIDWDEACVTEKNDGMLMHATDMCEEDFIRHGYAVIPLYTHPCVSPTSDKTACVSESAENETQTSSQVNLDNSNHIDDVLEMVPEGWQLVPVEPDQALLVSMATCLNHGFGLLTKEKQDGQLYDMRKLYDEVVGKGYYSPKTRERYLAMLAAAPKYTGNSNE